MPVENDYYRSLISPCCIWKINISYVAIEALGHNEPQRTPKEGSRLSRERHKSFGLLCGVPNYSQKRFFELNVALNYNDMKSKKHPALILQYSLVALNKTASLVSRSSGRLS
jgi:hypothetical protein